MLSRLIEFSEIIHQHGIDEWDVSDNQITLVNFRGDTHNYILDTGSSIWYKLGDETPVNDDDLLSCLNYFYYAHNLIEKTIALTRGSNE